MRLVPYSRPPLTTGCEFEPSIAHARKPRHSAASAVSGACRGNDEVTRSGRAWVLLAVLLSVLTVAPPAARAAGDRGSPVHTGLHPLEDRYVVDYLTVCRAAVDPDTGEVLGSYCVTRRVRYCDPERPRRCWRKAPWERGTREVRGSSASDAGTFTTTGPSGGNA